MKQTAQALKAGIIILYRQLGQPRQAVNELAARNLKQAANVQTARELKSGSSGILSRHALVLKACMQAQVAMQGAVQLKHESQYPTVSRKLHGQPPFQIPIDPPLQWYFK